MATQTVENQQGFAPVIEPFATNVLGAAEALTSNTDNPYQRYTGDQVAGYSPLQQQSYSNAATMQTAPQLADATALAGQAGLGALNTQYSYAPSGFGDAFSAANTKDAQGNITGNTMMNPFTGVMDAAARRNAGISQQGMQAQAANAGGFGGARDYINRNQGNADLQRNLGQNQFNAYNQAQQQYNTQYGQNAQQQQFGANLGMQGLGLANQSAQNLGALGQTQYAQNVGTIGLQNQMGGQQQQQAQNVMNTNYQNWAAEQNDPYKRLGFMSDIVRGAPLTQTGSSIMTPGPSSIQNLASLGMGAYGLNSLFGSAPPKANGGLTQAYANGGMVGYDSGGSVMSPQFKQYAVDHIDPRQLPMAQQNAQARGDMDTYQAIMQKMAEDAAMRRGIASALPPDTDVVRAAGGGILAFAKGGGPTQQELMTAALADRPQSTPEEWDAGVTRRSEGLSRLQGPSALDPFITEAAQQREQYKGGVSDYDKGMIALQMAGAMVDPAAQNNPFAAFGLASKAAGEMGSKIQAQNRQADRDLFKAQVDMASAQQARSDGRIKTAAELEDKAQIRADNAFEQKRDASGKMAQIISHEKISAATNAAANRPGETERMLAEYERRVGRKLTADEYTEALSQLGASRFGVKHTGQDKDIERYTALAKAHEGLRLLQQKQVQLGSLPNPNPAQKAALANTNAQITGIENKLRAQVRMSSDAPTSEAHTPTLQSIDALRKDPTKRDQFERWYGPGSSSKYLGE